MTPTVRLTEKQAAKVLDPIRPETLAKWRQRRKGPPFLKLGGKVFYLQTDIDAFLEQSRVVPSELPPRKRAQA